MEAGQTGSSSGNVLCRRKYVTWGGELFKMPWQPNKISDVVVLKLQQFV
jgi:hypothetical protein